LTGAEFGGEAATQALPALADTSGLVAGGSGAFDAAGSWVPSGTSAPVSAGSKFAQITDAIKQGKDLAGSFSNAGVGPDGNAAHAPQSSADAARAQALTNNRFLQTSKDQAGVATDTNVMRNQMRAALIARMTPGGFTTPGYRLNSGGTIAQPDLSATQSAIDFNKTYADKLRERQLAGQPMTLSGVPEASQEEKDATARALNNSGTGTGLNSDITRVGNAIDTGTRYADLGQNAYTKGKSIWNVVKGFF
jgi:hypothetical protein